MERVFFPRLEADGIQARQVIVEQILVGRIVWGHVTDIRSSQGSEDSVHCCVSS